MHALESRFPQEERETFFFFFQFNILCINEERVLLHRTPLRHPEQKPLFVLLRRGSGIRDLVSRQVGTTVVG